MRSAASLKPVRKQVGERGRATQWTGGLFGRERSENVPVHFADDDDDDDDDCHRRNRRHRH